ncbi:hypothetical protein K458DRAFT_436511, partial [Lentithecium fluviatile CBS 122367]
MADSASRSLLNTGDHGKPHNFRAGKRTTYKLPLLIFSFLLLLIGCIAASIVVLLTSNDNSVKSWSIRPQVLLSILAGLYSVLLGGLFTTGVAVVWWRSIIHGTTLKKLHFIDAGASPKDFVPAFIAGGHARRVALAALVAFSAKLAIGPMLQRSTRPQIQPVARILDMNIDLARVIPDGRLARWGSLGAIGIEASRDTFFGSNITTGNTAEYTCPSNGTCEAVVAGAGMNFNCRTSNGTIDLLDSRSVDSTLFGINLVLDENSTSFPFLYLETKWVSHISEDCVATLTTEECNMIPAIMWYNISIREDIVKPNFTDAYKNPKIFSNATSSADEHNEDPEAPAGPLKATEGALGAIYKSETRLDNLTEGRALKFYSGGEVSFWGRMFKISTTTGNSQSIDKCPLLWDSPTQTIMERILEFMFHSAALVGRSEPGHKQSFVAQYRGEEFWNGTDFRWFAASVIVMILGITAALSLLWGFWQLRGRYVTLSPLETSKAFGAPIFTAAGPEQEANSILKEVGHERVAYDGDELVWSGSVYATGAGGSLGTQSSGSREPGIGELEGGSSGHSSLRGRGHRRGLSSVSDMSPVQGRRPSFEHSLGFTTRRPYDDEEEMDIGQYGRPRSSSYGNDTTPLIPMPLNVSQTGSPKLPPIPPTGSIRMEPLT